jgi:hypothetical protein
MLKAAVKTVLAISQFHCMNDCIRARPRVALALQASLICCAIALCFIPSALIRLK